MKHVRTNMVLIETSDDKSPSVLTLGVREKERDYKCVLRLLENPFYPSLQGE